MIRGVITAPSRVIKGAFSIRFAFSEWVDLTADDIQIETLLGDALGDPRDYLLQGDNHHYVLQCYIRSAKQGFSRVSLKLPGVSVEPVDIEYDTVKVVKAKWGVPVKKGLVTEIPVAFDAELQHLRKRNFRFSEALPFQLHRLGDDYCLRISKRFESPLLVGVRGSVVKANEVSAEIAYSVLQVDVKENGVEINHSVLEV